MLNEPIAEPDDPGADWYMQAFWELSTCRAIGLAVGPIPWRDMIAYANEKRLDELTRRLFVYLMLNLDGVYLKKQKAKGKGDGGDKRGGGETRSGYDR